jgi:rhamnosyltransferase
MNPLPNAVSVVMRSFNEAWAIGDTIRQLFDQDFDGEIELIVIDSGSSDGSIDIIRESGRARLIQIPLGTYVPGVVLNQGAREATHDWIVYLNADATPVGRDWLVNLLKPCVANPKFGAAFSRQIPRPDCHAVFAHDYDRCFGPERESKDWEHFFSMVSSVTHKSVLEKVPIREDLQYAEDDEWTRRLVKNGYEVLYAIDSVAMHSHNYTLRQSYKRSFGDAKAMAATSTVPPRNVNYHYFVCLGLLKDAIRDAKWCIRNGRIAGIPHAVAVRLAQRLGRRDGHHAGWKFYHRDA